VVAGADPVGKQADDGPGHMAAAVVHFMGKHHAEPLCISWGSTRMCRPHWAHLYTGTRSVRVVPSGMMA
jgi:hypothetical protein